MLMRHAPTAPPYSLAIFDFDGTLADTLPWFLTLLEDVAARFDIAGAGGLDLEEMRALSAREIIARLGIPTWKLPRIAAHIHRLAADTDIALFDGAREALRSLHADGVALAVVSSNGEAAVRRALGTETAALIGQFACGAKLFGKAQVFRGVVRRAGAAPAQTICIGDEIRDGEAAKDAGLAFGAVSWGYNTPEALARTAPEHVFARMEEITAVVCARVR